MRNRHEFLKGIQFSWVKFPYSYMYKYWFDVVTCKKDFVRRNNLHVVWFQNQRFSVCDLFKLLISLLEMLSCNACTIIFLRFYSLTLFSISSYCYFWLNSTYTYYISMCTIFTLLCSVQLNLVISRIVIFAITILTMKSFSCMLYKY